MVQDGTKEQILTGLYELRASLSAMSVEKDGVDRQQGGNVKRRKARPQTS